MRAGGMTLPPQEGWVQEVTPKSGTQASDAESRGWLSWRWRWVVGFPGLGRQARGGGRCSARPQPRVHLALSCSRAGVGVGALEGPRPFTPLPLLSAPPGGVPTPRDTWPSPGWWGCPLPAVRQGRPASCPLCCGDTGPLLLLTPRSLCFDAASSESPSRTTRSRAIPRSRRLGLRLVLPSLPSFKVLVAT